MNSIYSQTSKRAPKIADGKRRPIVLSAQEYTEIQQLAMLENRSVQNFMRQVFKLGLEYYRLGSSAEAIKLP